MLFGGRHTQNEMHMHNIDAHAAMSLIQLRNHHDFVKEILDGSLLDRNQTYGYSIVLV
jgi:hypothetical protein